MPMYNLIEYKDIYSKISGSLWQYYKDEPAFTYGYIKHFHVVDNNSASFKRCSTKDGKIMMPLKYLSKFWRNLEMLLIQCEINLILAWC